MYFLYQGFFPKTTLIKLIKQKLTLLTNKNEVYLVEISFYLNKGLNIFEEIAACYLIILQNPE